MKYLWLFLIAVVGAIAVVIFGKELSQKAAPTTNINVSNQPVSQGSTALGGVGGQATAQGGQGGQGGGGASGSGGGGGGLGGVIGGILGGLGI